MFSLSLNSVAVGTSVANSDEISYGEFSCGEVHIPAGSSITTLTWHVAQEAGGTYLPAQDATGAVAQTVAHTKSFPIPEALKGARFLKAVGNAAGEIGVCLKQA